MRKRVNKFPLKNDRAGFHFQLRACLTPTFFLAAITIAYCARLYIFARLSIERGASAAFQHDANVTCVVSVLVGQIVAVVHARFLHLH